MQHRFRLCDQSESPRPDRHAGHQIAEHRAQAETPEQRHHDDAGGEIDDGLLQKAVGFHD